MKNTFSISPKYFKVKKVLNNFIMVINFSNFVHLIKECCIVYNHLHEKTSCTDIMLPCTYDLNIKCIQIDALKQEFMALQINLILKDYVASIYQVVILILKREIIN